MPLAAAWRLPPYGLWPVLLISFPCLVWLLDGALEPGSGRRVAKLRTGFGLGWLFGFGYFLAGLWWIGSAFLVEADRFAWLMPFAVLAMPAGLALFTGLGVGAGRAGLVRPFPQRILLLAACLTLADWLRGHVLTGFPWNAFGYGLSGSLTLSQAASLVGIYGLTFLVVAIGAAPALLADVSAVADPAGALGVPRSPWPDLCWQDTGPSDLWQPAGRRTLPSTSASCSPRSTRRTNGGRSCATRSFRPSGHDGSAAGRRGADRPEPPGVWPESAVPFLLTQEPGRCSGSARCWETPRSSSPVPSAANRASVVRTTYNSVYLIGGDGTVSGIYDKVRLVPFGEYVPLKPLLENLGITNLAGPLDGFEAGYQPRVLSTSEGFSFLPMICYEAIFPGALAGAKGAPSFLLNVTNDAWFGRTPGPYQHFAQARCARSKPVCRWSGLQIQAFPPLSAPGVPLLRSWAYLKPA